MGGDVSDADFGAGYDVSWASELNCVLTAVFPEPDASGDTDAGQQAECLKAAHESGLKMRTMVTALGVAGVVGVISAFWALTHLSYGRMYASPHPGALGSAFSQEAVNTLASWLTSPIHANYAGVAAIGIGAAVALILARLSVGFLGFPFPPSRLCDRDVVWDGLHLDAGDDQLVAEGMYPTVLGAARVTNGGAFLCGAGARGVRHGRDMWSFVRGVMGVQTYTFFIF